MLSFWGGKSEIRSFFSRLILRILMILVLLVSRAAAGRLRE